MKPWQMAKKWQTENSDIPFEQLLGAYMNEGYVWNSPTEFILAKPVCMVRGKMINSIHKNCWFVQLAGGARNPLKRFLELAPMPLKYVAWQRHGSDRYHVHTWDHYEKRVERDGKHKHTTTSAS